MPRKLLDLQAEQIRNAGVLSYKFIFNLAFSYRICSGYLLSSRQIGINFPVYVLINLRHFQKVLTVQQKKKIAPYDNLKINSIYL